MYVVLFVIINCFLLKLPSPSSPLLITDLTAAILQQPFFDAQRPAYMNYGAIGQFIGHEITHGFDIEGRLFDWHGNLVDWWRNDTELEFTAKAHCFDKQYSSYETDEGQHVSFFVSIFSLKQFQIKFSFSIESWTAKILSAKI